MSIVVELIGRALTHSSILERVLSALSEYSEGKISEEDARIELDEIDDEIEAIKQRDWEIVRS